MGTTGAPCSFQLPWVYKKTVPSAPCYRSALAPTVNIPYGSGHLRRAKRGLHKNSQSPSSFRCNPLGVFPLGLRLQIKLQFTGLSINVSTSLSVLPSEKEGSNGPGSLGRHHFIGPGIFNFPINIIPASCVYLSITLEIPWRQQIERALSQGRFVGHRLLILNPQLRTILTVSLPRSLKHRM